MRTLTRELAIGYVPIYLWEPSHRQWERWLKREYDPLAFSKVPPQEPAAVSKGMQWRLRQGTVDDVIDYAQGPLPIYAGEKYVVGPAYERVIRDQLRLIAHPAMRKPHKDMPIAYLKAIRRVQLAMSVVAASAAGNEAVAWSLGRAPLVYWERHHRDHSLETALDRFLASAESLAQQVRCVSKWAANEFDKCIRTGMITPPRLLSPTKLKPPADDNMNDDDESAEDDWWTEEDFTTPPVGIATGVYGLTIMWLLNALREPPASLGTCAACYRPFLGTRVRRRRYCSDACRAHYFRAGGEEWDEPEADDW